MKRTICACAAIWTMASTSHALVLTGVTVYSTTTSGNPSGGQFWNTYGNDGAYNLYVRQAGVWLNSGNSATTRVAINLAPGVHTFEIYGQPGSQSHFGISLMFDGVDNAPRIAANNPSSSSSTAFNVTSSGTVYDLLNTARPTPNSLTYANSGITATLTQFVYQTPAMQPTADWVQAHNNTPGGGNDYHGLFELTVVPEPASVTALGIALLGLLRVRRKI